MEDFSQADSSEECPEFKGNNYRFIRILEGFLIVILVIFVSSIMLVGALGLGMTLVMLSYITTVLLLMRVRRIISGQQLFFYQYYCEHKINDNVTRIKYSDIKKITKFPSSKRPALISIQYNERDHLTISRIDKMGELYGLLHKKSSLSKHYGNNVRKQKIFVFVILTVITAGVTIAVSSSSLIFNSNFLLLIAVVFLGLLYFVLNRLYNLGSEAIPYLIGLLPIVLYNPYNQFMYNKCKHSFMESCYSAVEREFKSSTLSDHANLAENRLIIEQNDILHVLKAGCQIGHRKSCYNTSVAYRNSGDFKLAGMYGEKACHLKFAISCYDTAKLYVSMKDYDKGIGLLKQALNYKVKKDYKEIYKDFPELVSQEKFKEILKSK